jgi:uroporphyrinogen III methyltransferase/synthase
LSALASVEQVAVYSQVDCANPDPEIMDRLRRGSLDYVTLTSSNVARAFLRALDVQSGDRIKSAKVGLISISPVTTAAIRELGFPVAGEATEYTTNGVIEAMLRTARGGLSSERESG